MEDIKRGKQRLESELLTDCTVKEIKDGAVKSRRVARRKLLARPDGSRSTEAFDDLFSWHGHRKMLFNLPPPDSSSSYDTVFCSPINIRFQRDINGSIYLLCWRKRNESSGYNFLFPSLFSIS